MLNWYSENLGIFFFWFLFWTFPCYPKNDCYLFSFFSLFSTPLKSYSYLVLHFLYIRCFVDRSVGMVGRHLFACVSSTIRNHRFKTLYARLFAQAMNSDLFSVSLFCLQLSQAVNKFLDFTFSFFSFSILSLSLSPYLFFSLVCVCTSVIVCRCFAYIFAQSYFIFISHLNHFKVCLLIENFDYCFRIYSFWFPFHIGSIPAFVTTWDIRRQNIFEMETL